jgi:nuclear RNA export factor
MSRGGVQKRWAGPTRIDKDGDLVMDPADGSEVPGRGRPEGTVRHSHGRTVRAGHKLTTLYGSHASQQTQQGILRGLESQYANILDTRITHGILGDREAGMKPQTRDIGANICLRVRGLKESKVASNPDGGLKDLLNFLERKASGLDAEPRRAVRIKKVCLFITTGGFSEALFRHLCSTLAPRPAMTNLAYISIRTRNPRPKSRLNCPANIT